MIHFPDLVRKNAFRTPDRRATHFEGRDFTWAQFCTRLHAMAHSLITKNVKPGDRVAFLGFNSHWLVEMYFVPCMIGAISVPINHRLSEDEMVELIDDCQAEVLFIDRNFQDRAQNLMSRCASLRALIYADWDRDLTALPEGTDHYETLIDTAGDVPVDAFTDLGSQSDDTMIIFYTSGTTGRPKGVMLTHANLLVNATGAGHLYGFSPDDVLLLSGPLFHLATGSRVYTATAYGAAMVIQSRFDVIETMQIVAEQRVTTVTLVPTMLRMIMDHPGFAGFDFSSIRCLTYGAAPMPVSLLERTLVAVPGVQFCQGYGMSETSPVLTILPPEDHIPGSPGFAKLASVGKPVIYCDMRVVDENDQPLPIGEPGQILVRGPQVMNGYWNRPTENAEALKGGFYHTGDAGYFDEDGYLYLVGRTKEMIISGGENVYPIETENCLTKHPAVAQAAVIGLADDKWGERVHAIVALHDGAQVTGSELIAFCREKIAHYKAPKGVTLWPESLPLSATNKIDKTALRTQLEKGMTQ